MAVKIMTNGSRNNGIILYIWAGRAQELFEDSYDVDLISY